MDFRARFAPSPTGQVHIGNIRTAIFNWLATRHAEGMFLMRVEDTDLERSTQDAIDKLFDCMKWLGLDYDGEVMYQTKQSAKHIAAAEKLLADENAYKLNPNEEHSPLLFRLPYKCDGLDFVKDCGSAEIDLAPDTVVSLNFAQVDWQTLTAKGKIADNTATIAGFKDLQILNKDGNVLYTLDDAARESLPRNPQEKFKVEHASKMKFIRREVFFDDLVKGHLAKPLDSMKDFIIVRSDGSPVFHLANVYDDMQQNVTYIVRGDDHVENTYRHLFLFAALGFTPPSYAHLPMIVNAAGKPYSKRDGDAFVGDFKKKGYLPQALFNYLALLGWSPGDDREKMTREEMIKAFHIERALRSPAQFDIAKLNNMNGLYIAEMPFEEFLAEVLKYLPEYCPEGIGNAKLEAVARLMQSRTKTFADVAHWNYFFRAADRIEFDPKAVKKLLSNEGIRSELKLLAEKWSTEPDETALQHADLETELRGIEAKLGLQQGKFNQPLRIAVTGTNVGAGIHETVEIIGRRESAARIIRALTAGL